MANDAPSLATLRSMAGKLGATIEVNPLGIRDAERREYREYVAVAPKGKIWGASDAHDCVNVYEPGGYFETDAATRTACAGDMAVGLIDCLDGAECDICNDNGV